MGYPLETFKDFKGDDKPTGTRKAWAAPSSYGGTPHGNLPVLMIFQATAETVTKSQAVTEDIVLVSKNDWKADLSNKK